MSAATRDSAKSDSDDDRSRDRLAALLAAAARGDESAWRGLVDAYVSRVHGLLRSQCGDAELAEEITQSTFCTIAAKLASYEELGRFESWLFRIAMNRLRDEMRRRKRQALLMDQAPLSALAIAPKRRDAVDPAVRRILEDAIRSLGEADREVISLRHTGELSFKQMADTLQEPLGTLLARNHRALRKLREYLEEHGVDASQIFHE